MKSLLLKSVFFFFIATFCWACTGSKEEKDDFSSAKSLYVDYVSSHTAGIVSSKAKIKVKLARKAPQAKAGDLVNSDLFDFEPSVKGTAFWEDAYTIAFEPGSPLKDDTRYKVAENTSLPYIPLKESIPWSSLMSRGES